MHTILVVDDTPENLELLDEALRNRYRVKVALSGERALALAQAEPPDLILLDVNMPGMDGYEVCKRLKASPRTAAIPVIFITARTDRTDERQGLELGAVDYVTKPISVPVVLARVRTQLALYTQQRTLEETVRNRTQQLAETNQRLEREMAERERAMQRASFLANNDDLTGLPNRRQLVERLASAFERSRRTGSGGVAVVLVSLDRFSLVSDSLGMLAGDRLLAALAQRLADRARASDLVARTGAEDFCLLLNTETGASPSMLEAAALRAGQEMLDDVAKPLLLEGQSVELAASAGIAIYPGDGDTPSEMLKHAAAAQVHAKLAGRNKLMRYRPELAPGGFASYETEKRLNRALENNELKVFYQPKLDTTSRRLTGAEALIRWPDGDGGYFKPSDFIPLAEECGLIERLDEFVLRSVLRQLRLWRGSMPPDFRIAVNVSAYQFRDPEFPDKVLAMIKEYDPPAGHLEFEVTEHALIGDMARATETLNLFRDHGIHLALDDFGTGYSSLAYLQKLPLQHLKIDQSFIRDIEHNPNGAAIVRAVIALASSLNLTTIAEGVENIAQLDYVRDLGCPAAQGFLFSPAVPADRFEQFFNPNPDAANGA